MTDWKHLMHMDAWCNFCGETTKTKEWDCVNCGPSKPISSSIPETEVDS